ncbi:MAG TPA: hypothetical protein VED40_11735 [Azospirillaceae bacterium]|nr:hypothetical protein [Azospirillaceae bacterium]
MSAISAGLMSRSIDHRLLGGDAPGVQGRPAPVGGPAQPTGPTAGTRLAGALSEMMRSAKAMAPGEADEAVRREAADSFKRDLSKLLTEVGYDPQDAQEKAGMLTDGAFSGRGGIISLSLDRVQSMSVAERYTAQGTKQGVAFGRSEERAASITLEQSFDLTLDLASGDFSLERAESLTRTASLRVEEFQGASPEALLAGLPPPDGAPDAGGLEGLMAKLKEGGAGGEAVRSLTALDTLLKGLTDGRTGEGNRLSLGKAEAEGDSLKLRLTLSRTVGAALASTEGADALFRTADGPASASLKGVRQEV